MVHLLDAAAAAMRGAGSASPADSANNL